MNWGNFERGVIYPEGCVMEKILIAVLACHNFNYDMTSIDQCMVLHRSGMDYSTYRPPFIRETWWNDVPEHVGKKFFFGRQTPAPRGRVAPLRQPLDDEIFLDVKDDYVSLPYKTRGVCRWARENGYTRLCKADDDTFMYVDRLLASDYEKHAWIGRYNGGNFVAGGPAYWLDEAAINAVADAPISRSHWAEDIWVSGALLEKGFTPHFDERYVDLRRGAVDDNTIAVCECDQHKMRALHGGIL